jgi:hypothetical protein
MKRFLFICILIAAMLMSSCSQKLPVPVSGENGILVIPTQSRNFTRYPNGYYYTFLYSPETQVQIKAVPLGSRKFIIIDSFPAGEYQITGIKSLSSPSGGTPFTSSDTNEFTTPISFQIRPNELTLLEYMFSVEQNYPDNTVGLRYSQGYVFKPLSESQYSQVVIDLRNLPNAENWNLDRLPATATTDQKNGVTSTNLLYLRWPIVD